MSAEEHAETFDSWEDLDLGDRIRYVGDFDHAWWLDHPLTFRHGYANAAQVRVETVGNGPHDLSIEDYPPADFVRVAESA
jgi:hypothetical protein